MRWGPARLPGNTNGCERDQRESQSIQAAGYQAHLAVLARRTQEKRHWDGRAHFCAVRELTKLMSEMRGEWAQLEGKMAHPTELEASQEGYVTDKPLRQVAPQRTNHEEALMADWEAASSRFPAVKPWVTDPEAVSTQAPSTDEEKGQRGRPPLRSPESVRMPEEGEARSEKSPRRGWARRQRRTTRENGGSWPPSALSVE